MSKIYLTLQERMTLLQTRANMANAKATQSQEIANIAFAKMAEQGLIEPEVAAEHLDAFQTLDESQELPDGALRKIGDGEDARLVICVKQEMPAVGKQKAYTSVTWETIGGKTIDQPVIGLPVEKGL